MKQRKRPTMKILLCAALVAALAPLTQAPALGAPGSEARVVVAVIDASPNPYHRFFHTGSPIYKKSAPSSVTPAVLKEFGIDKKHIIDLTRTGKFKADYEADRQIWKNIERGQAYWFKGTNVIAISFVEEKGERLLPDDGSAHGVGTGAAVLTANPEAIIVMVESPGANALPNTPGYATQPLGEELAFNHPAVDIITTSYGPPFSPPTMYHLNNSYVGVVENGKLHFGAADNSPALSPVDATSGPWWSIGIAGYQEGESGGRTPQSGTLPDFVSDWTQTLPYCKGCEKGISTVSGTSFATPRSAGLTSKILLEARRAAGHLGPIVTKGVELPVMVKGRKGSLTNWQIRRALEEAAYYPTNAEYQPGTDGYPIIEQAPWSVTGWGILTTDVRARIIEETLAQLGIRGKPTRSKAGAPCDFMTANMEARKAYWNNAAYSESNGTTAYPYLPCNVS